MNTQLYSERMGRRRGLSSAEIAIRTWTRLYKWIYERGLLDEAFGYSVNSWRTQGNKLAIDINVEGKHKEAEEYYVNRLRTLIDFDYSAYGGGFVNLSTDNSEAPLSLQLDEELFFDFLEATHEVCSEPQRRGNSREHLSYDSDKGKALFRERVNSTLSLGEVAAVMLSNGQVVLLENDSIESLANDALQLEASRLVGDTTIEPMQAAIVKYLDRSASLNDKRQAITDIVGALESVRAAVKKNLLSEDEKELFKIANNFGIRHNNPKQKTSFDKNIWFDWMFQVNLAALLTTVRIIQSQE